VVPTTLREASVGVETRSRTWRKTTQEGASCGVSHLLDTSFVPECELVKVVVVVVIVGQARLDVLE
jgi:hypothetical protein